MSSRPPVPSSRRGSPLLPFAALSACALLATGAAPRADGLDGGAPRPVVLRIHSLAGLVEHDGFEGGSLSLLPYRTGTQGAQTSETYANERAERGAPCSVGAEDVVAFLRGVVDPEVWESGTSRLDLSDESRLVVTAPAETQERIASLLGELLKATAPATTLHVAVLRGAAPADTATLVDFKTADALDAQLEVARQVQVALAGRNSVTADSFVSGSGVFDWEVEIAQGAMIGTPVVASFHAGLEVVARAVPADGGTYVDLLVRESEPAADAAARTLDARGAIVAQQVVNERAAGGLVQHPRLGFVSYAGTCFVPAGRALLLPASVQTHLGPVAFTLDVRFAGEVAAARTTLDFKPSGDGAPKQIGFIGLGLAALGRLGLPRLPASLFDSGAGASDDPVWLAALSNERSIDRANDVANSVAQPAIEAGSGSVATWGNWLLTTLPADVSNDVADALATFDRRGGGEIAGRIVAGTTEVGRFRVPYVEDHPLEVWSGVQGTRVAGWDVEVATEALVPNPQMEAWVDGFALRLSVARDARGRAVLHANGVVNLLDGPPQKTELNDANHLSIETVRARRCAFDDARTIPEGKPLRAFFGSGELTVDLELKPR